MTKILRGPDAAGAIIGANGRLRTVGPKPRCKGYSNGCHCKPCLEREARTLRQDNCLDAVPALSCECDRPLPDTQSESCTKCGKRITLAA